MNYKLPANLENIIESLNEDQLRLLNLIVVDKLKIIHKAKQLKEMIKFYVGDLVSFKHGDEKIIGKIIRLNQKTVSVFTNKNQRWNVAPTLLTLENENNEFVKEVNPEKNIKENNNTTSFTRDNVKSGRNAPCPCGSGKKYKKCCGE